MADEVKLLARCFMLISLKQSITQKIGSNVFMFDGILTLQG
jgi:hypothetical protein